MDTKKPKKTDKFASLQILKSTLAKIKELADARGQHMYYFINELVKDIK